MGWPKPVPGLVVRYAFLWSDQARRLEAGGRKDRPSAIITAVEDSLGRQVVVVLPMTTRTPTSADDVVELSAGVRRRLCLGQRRSWVVLTEANTFVWPGPDLTQARAGEIERAIFGQLPKTLTNLIRERFLERLAVGTVAVTPRTP